MKDEEQRGPGLALPVRTLSPAEALSALYLFLSLAGPLSTSLNIFQGMEEGLAKNGNPTLTHEPSAPQPGLV